MRLATCLTAFPRLPGPVRVLLGLGLAWAAGAALNGQPDPSPLPPPVSGIVADYRARIPGWLAEDRIPGLAVVLVLDGRAVWAEGFGHTDDGARVPVTPETAFSLQSNSKMFTALAVLVAVQEGRVDLDAPIAGYLPGFTLRSPFQARPEERITLRHLLSHTAGLAHEAPVGNNYDSAPGTFEAHVQSIRRTWLRYPVGERYCYSNLGVDLAGYLLQRVYGKPFPEVAREKLLAPLEMRRSSFEIREIRAAPGRAIGHDPFDPRPPLLVPMVPSGGLYSSARDLGAFLEFQLRGGRSGGAVVLDEPLLREFARVPLARPDQRDGYALGIYRAAQHGTYSLSHSGGGFGFLSYILWYPELGLGAAVLTNATGHNRHAVLAEGLADAVIAATGRSRPIPKRPPVAWKPLPPDQLSRWRGSYLNERYREWNIVADGGGLALQTQVGHYPLRFTAPDAAEFTWGDSVSRLRFSPGSPGRPATIRDLDDGSLFDFNDGPGVPPGLDRPEWRRYEGRYRVKVHGWPGELVTIGRRNGYLYANGLRLEEHSPGLFFGCTGDGVDFGGAYPTFRNIRLEKIEIHPLAWLVLGLGGLVLFSAAGTAGWSAWRRRRLAAGPSAGLPGRRWAAGVAWTAAGTSIAVFGIVLTQFPQVIGLGLPWNPRLPTGLKVAYWAPVAAVLFSGLTAAAALLAWTRWRGPAGHRWVYAAVAAALAAGAVLMVNWRLWPM